VLKCTAAGGVLVTINLKTSFCAALTPLIMSIGAAHILLGQEVQFSVWRAARKASLIPRINPSLESHRSPGHTTDENNNMNIFTNRWRQYVFK